MDYTVRFKVESPTGLKGECWRDNHGPYINLWAVVEGSIHPETFTTEAAALGYIVEQLTLLENGSEANN